MTTLDESGAASALPRIDISRSRDPAAGRTAFLAGLRQAAHE